MTPQVPTTFDFAADGGLLPAAELCAGVGACRKTRDGTMCPSFQATRNEKDSTRGRANLLRLAISGQLGFEGFTDPAVRDVLDLCLECKACKSECPTNVDMARLKAEFLHQYHRQHGLPWRNRIFGHVAQLGRMGSALAPVSNWLMQNGLSRWINHRWLGIDSRRVLPSFARQSLTQRFSSLAWNDNIETTVRHVLLFPDTFANYFQPEVGAAAIELLQRAGCSVTLGPPGLRCCGRPFISNGLLDQAVANAQHNVERLHQWASGGGLIVACEPSCILTIKDDYPALLRGDHRTRAETVARASLTFEEYLDSIITEAGRDILRWKPGPRKVLVQTHCHQRALVGAGPVINLLRSLPGRRSSTLTPVAAAWLVRLVMRRSITKSPGSWVSSASCQPSAGPIQTPLSLHQGSRAASRSSISPVATPVIRRSCFNRIWLEGTATDRQFTASRSRAW